MITPAEKLYLIDDMIDTFKFQKSRCYKTKREKLIAADVLLDDIQAVIGSSNVSSMNNKKALEDI